MATRPTRWTTSRELGTEAGPCTARKEGGVKRPHIIPLNTGHGRTWTGPAALLSNPLQAAAANDASRVADHGSTRTPAAGACPRSSRHRATARRG